MPTIDLDALTSIYEGSKLPPFWRVGLYGEPGSGKTTLASTFPKPYFVNADKGMAAVLSDVPQLLLPEDFKDTYELVVQLLDAARLKTGIFGPGGKAAGTLTLVLDSMTALADAIFNQVMRQAHLDPLKDKATFDEWGVFQRRMIDIAARVKDASTHFNIVETFWAVAKEADTTKVVGGYPSIPGSYRERCAGDLDEFYFMEAKKVPGANGADKLEITLNSAPKGIYKGKTRLLADLKIVDPSYAKLVESAKRKRGLK